MREEDAVAGSRSRRVALLESGKATLQALHRLAPVVRAGHGRRQFLLATGGWLAQTVTEWGVAILLLVFLASLGLLPDDALPVWVPRAVVDSGIIAIWGALLAMAVLQSAFQIVSLQARAQFSQGIEARLRVLLAHFALMRDGMPPDLSRINFLTSEAFARTTGFFFHLSQVVCLVLQALALGGAMLYVEPLSAGVALAGIVVFGSIVLWFNRLNDEVSSRLPQAQAAYEQSKVRLARNWLYIRALRLQRQEFARQLEAAGRIYRYNLVGYFFGNLGGMLGPVFGVFLVASIVLVHATVQSAPAAVLLPFFYLLFRFQQLLAGASHLIGGLFTFGVHLQQSASFAAEMPRDEVARVLRETPTFGGWKKGRAAATAVAGVARGRVPPPTLSMRELAFAWRPAAEPLFSGISVELAAGRQLAIVGANGTGKSTLLALLLGALSPTAGEVLLDSEDRRQWLSRNHTNTAFVGTEPYLIAGTVRDNLCYGLPWHADDEQLWQRLRQVGLATRVESSACGLDYRIAETSDGLSAGEQQKLAMARALLREPALLVLDEPTAHIDADSERDIAESLHQLAGGCTVVVVSHKPGVVGHADLVLKLDGRPTALAPSGPPSEA